MIGIYHGLSGICSHTTGSHLVGSEHHDAVGTHAVAFNLAIILAELLLTDCSSLWPINSRAFVVQRGFAVFCVCLFFLLFFFFFFSSRRRHTR
jgi:hypothetical protein